ncbi:PREDICTED: uncharacterized protein LOC108523219 isoform X2 [Rhinopithecus bieti]|uniref:uncharacterized protein LOC108523219 isoform X2 n=1 Tax=Rhinopithecus bieti TaxID=61621 RepID=UPI00083C7639|nr:PREDICTED: uncharacterized protein LOC108523219 isoform X2 [Rhinopithecus bieti]
MDEKMLGTQCCCLVAMETTAYYPALSFIKKELHLTEAEENACSLQHRRKKSFSCLLYVTEVICTRMPRLAICSKIAQKALPCIPLLHTSPLCLQLLSAGLHIYATLFKSCASRNPKNI